MLATITWAEVNGKGTLFCDFEDGTRRTHYWDVPINARTDSWEIAEMFGDPFCVDHDGEFIHAAYH